MRAEPDLSPCQWDDFLSSAPAGGLAATVLIVEDDEDLACLLEYRLRRERLNPVVARDGEAACRELSRNPTIELVLLDLLLPDKDGWAVCQFIRQHPEPRLASLPVVILSALASEDNRVRGMECGADVYIAKPYSAREVVLASLRLLARRRSHLNACAEIETLRNHGHREEELRRLLFHELRSKCVVIGGLCRRLLRDEAGGRVLGEEKELEYLEVINQGVRQLASLADGALILAEPQGQGGWKLTPAELRVDQVVAEVVAVCGAKAELKGIRLLAPRLVPLTVCLHRLGLTVILSNLLENAIKYSPPGTEVTLSVSLAGPGLRLEILDQGPGIPLEEQGLVFRAYYRGQTARLGNTETGGGLGLYLVRRFAEGLGGQVTLTSPPEGGCRFAVYLPLPQPDRCSTA